MRSTNYTLTVLEQLAMAKRDARARRGSDKHPTTSDARIVSPPATLGAQASERWLVALGLPAVPHWCVEVSITADLATSLEVNIYAEEWGFAFHHNGRSSWIRVTDIPFVHGRDDFRLLTRTPDLLAIDLLALELEAEHGIAFTRDRASIRTNVPRAAEIVGEWLVQSLPYSAVKQTIELCGDEMHRGIRCTKDKGHEDDHEYVASDVSGNLRWK